MRFLFSLFCIFFVTYISPQAFAQSMKKCSTSEVSGAICNTNGVLIYAPNSSTATFAPPSDSLSVGQLQITYSVTLDGSNVTGYAYDATKWGVVFGSPASSTIFYYPNSTTLPSGVTVKVDASKVSSSGVISAGTVVVTIDFTQSSTPNKLTSDMVSLISSTGILQIQPIYAGSSNITSATLAFNWQADTGAMLYAPSISIIAADEAFIVNLSPPSSLNAATQTPTTSTATALTATTNSLSGYVIIYWLDCDASGNSYECRSSPGNWQFVMNRIAFATAPSNSGTACTYTPYQSSFNEGGSSNALGCPSITGNLPFDTTISASSLTGDSIAIPFTPTVSNPTQFPSDSNGASTGACYRIVYVPSSQSTWSKTGIKNGDIYGVVAWALNSAYPIPNYSLAHSNIYYITGTNLPSASLDKSPNLPLTTDCFVVTAASGNPNSQSVFYWRILRDEYLTPIGITPFYYKHAKTWASWLDKHPNLKPALNTFFEYSGKIIYRTSKYLKKSKEFLKTFIKKLENIWTQEAGALELQEIPKTAPSVKNEMQNDSSEESLDNSFQPPSYDIFITGGILLPSTDKYYYDKYYSSQMSTHFDAGANYIFWFGNFGLSTGLLGRYTMNSNNGSVSVLGVQQQYTLKFYAMTAEVLIGVRYRNPCWSYLQPGVFMGAGATRFREEASTVNSSSSTSSNYNPLGVTQYSPIYEFGGNLDINLIPLFSVNPGDLGDYLSDVLLRLSASYNINPTPALSSTGVFAQAGFVFLLN
jgi:hypothetical protein